MLPHQFSVFEAIYTNATDPVVLEIMHNKRKVKVLQRDKKLDARIVGFSTHNELAGLLKKYIQR